jgi:hypothetical protein
MSSGDQQKLSQMIRYPLANSHVYNGLDSSVTITMQC